MYLDFLSINYSRVKALYLSNMFDYSTNIMSLLSVTELFYEVQSGLQVTIHFAILQACDVVLTSLRRKTVNTTFFLPMVAIRTIYTQKIN